MDKNSRVPCDKNSSVLDRSLATEAALRDNLLEEAHSTCGLPNGAQEQCDKHTRYSP